MRASISRRWSMVVGWSIPLLAVLLEVLWVHACLWQVSNWRDIAWHKVPMSLGGALLLVIAAEMLTRLGLSIRWRIGYVRAAVLSALVLLLAAIVRIEMGGGYGILDAAWAGYAYQNLPPVVAALVCGVYLLWRGIAVGRERMEFEDLSRKFLLGLAVFIGLVVFQGVTLRGQEVQKALSTLRLYVIAHFGVGLLSLGLTNLQAARETMQRHEGQGTLLGRRWAVLLTGVVLAIVLAGFGIASVFSFRMASTALHYLNILANWLLTGVLYVIGYPLGVLAAGLVYALRFLARFFGGGKAPQQPFTPPDFSDIQNAAEGEAVWNMPHAAVLAIKWGVVALLAAVVLFLLARALSRYWGGGRDDEVEEVSESLWSWDSFKGDILGFLAGLFGRFRVRRPVSTPEPSPPAAASADLQEERLFTVREIYAGLLWEAEQAGVPRHDAQTPYEYRASLESSLDARPPELEAITDAYVVERYGLVETPSERLPHLNRLWRQLRALLAAWQAQSRVP